MALGMIVFDSECTISNSSVTDDQAPVVSENEEKIDGGIMALILFIAGLCFMILLIALLIYICKSMHEKDKERKAKSSMILPGTIPRSEISINDSATKHPSFNDDEEVR